MTTFSRVLKNKSYKDAVARYENRARAINKVAKLISQGKAIDVESDQRIRLYRQRERELAEHFSNLRMQQTKNSLAGLEAVTGTSRDFLTIEFFEAGLQAAASVGRVNVRFESEFGTGFLVGLNLMMTNNHVIPDVATAESSSLELDFESNHIGAAKTLQQFELDPERFFLSDKVLDFTLVAVRPESAAGASLSAYGFHPLIPREGKIRIGDAVNIIQHPQGRMKTVVVHNSNLLHLENGTDLDPFLWYSSDTEPGSSGSPVFNNRWEVVALHHRAVPKMQNGKVLSRQGVPMSNAEVDQQRDQVHWLANEGIRASRLSKCIEAAHFDNEGHTLIRDDLIKLWTATKTGSFGLERAVSRRNSKGGGADVVVRNLTVDTSRGKGETNPLNINIRVSLE